MLITVLRRTKYNDDGYVFEAPARSLFQRSVRLYLVGTRTNLFGLSAQIDLWQSQVDEGSLTLAQVLTDLRRISGQQHPIRHTLLPYRTIYRFEVAPPSSYGAI